MGQKIYFNKKEAQIDELNDGQVRVTLFNEENHWDGDVTFNKDEWDYIIRKSIPERLIRLIIKYYEIYASGYDEEESIHRTYLSITKTPQDGDKR